jgi:hypothetical protein
MDNSSTRRRLIGSLCALVVVAGFGMASSAQAATSSNGISSLSKTDTGIVQPASWRTN